MTLNLIEGLGAIDFTVRVGFQAGVGGHISGQGIQIVTNGLGTEVLASGVPGKTGNVFQAEPVLEALEGLLTAIVYANVVNPLKKSFTISHL